jgi:hypothetical protein
MWYWLILIILLFLLFFKSNFATGGSGRGRFHGIGPDISGRPKDPELQFKFSSNTPQFYILMG